MMVSKILLFAFKSSVLHLLLQFESENMGKILHLKFHLMFPPAQKERQILSIKYVKIYLSGA